VAVDFDRYDDVAVNSLRLTLEMFRKQVDSFACWQYRCQTGRPACEGRILLVGFLVQQLLGLTFREAKGVLDMVRPYYRIKRVPDHSTLSKKQSSKRWTTVLERFFRHLLYKLLARSAVVATDATGDSGRKRGWRETKHSRRAIEDWVNVHAPIEIDEFVVLSYSLTRSNVHDSREFSNMWDRLPSNIGPIRSLADSAYVGNDHLAAARQHGATPFHSNERNACHVAKPIPFFSEAGLFCKHWPLASQRCTPKGRTW